MGGGIDQFPGVPKKIRASGSSLACTDEYRFVGGIGSSSSDFHHEYLIAGEFPGGVVTLKNQLFPRWIEICFRIIATVGELPKIGKVGFYTGNLCQSSETETPKQDGSKEENSDYHN